MKYIAIITLLMLINIASLKSQTAEEVKKELIRQKIPHHKIVLAQARLETGNFKSRQCKVNNNIFGIKHRGKYAKYKSWKDCVADYKKSISSRYKGGSYYAFLRNIKYAKDPLYENKLRKF